jgi:hypothetical protein
MAELTPGMRMKLLFETAKAATSISPNELDRLFAESSYEARLAAFCILDFQARQRLGDLTLRDTYLRHHDRIDDWGMVDRAAPRVVGATLTRGPYDLLHELAASADPLRRRTAMTAPLWFLKVGDDSDVGAGLAVAEMLHDDPDPLSTSRSASISPTRATDCRIGSPSSSTNTARRCRARRTASHYASGGQRRTAADRTCTSRHAMPSRALLRRRAGTGPSRCWQPRRAGHIPAALY